MNENAPALPRAGARAAGAVWLAYFVAALLSGLFLRGLVIPGDAAATATSLLGHETLYRSGLAFDLAGNVLYMALAVLLYRLMKPVERRVALLALCFSLTGCALQLGGNVLQFAPLLLLTKGAFLGAFTSAQVQQLALLALELRGLVFYVSLVLFALFELCLGYLIVRSRFLPRSIGVLWLVAGLAWLTFLWPPLALAIMTPVASVGGIAELVLMAWLLVKGVDAGLWHETATAPRLTVHRQAVAR